MSSIAASEPVRAIILGCGAIAGGYDADGKDGIFTHAASYRATPGVQVVACVDPDRDARSAFANRWAIPNAFDSLDDAELEFDLVSICTPTPRHLEDLAAARTRGARAVWCEKPISFDGHAARSMVEEYEAAGIGLAVNYLRRWDDSMQDLGRALQAGEWGRIQLVTGWYGKGLLTNGSHMIDLLSFLLGDLEVVSAGRVLTDYVDADPSVEALLRAPGGCEIQLRVADSRCFTLFEIDILTEAGRIRIEESGFAQRFWRKADSDRFAGYKILKPAGDGPTGIGRAMPNALANILGFLADGRPLASTGRSAITTQDLCGSIRNLAGLA